MNKMLEKKLGISVAEFDHDIAERYATGKSIASISREIGISATTVGEHLAKQGIHIRKESDNFNKNITKEEIERLYYDEHHTIKEMMEYLGCKSDITAAKILHSFGIDTNDNMRRSFKTRKGMSDEEFKDYLYQEYILNERSMASLAEEFDVSPTIIKRYLDKYGIDRRTMEEQRKITNSPNRIKGYVGDTNEKSYIGVRIGKQKYKYQHRMIVEQQIGRTLKRNEVVHHIDGNRHNNNPSNLILLENAEHAKLHSLLRKGIAHEQAIKEVRILWTCEQ